MRVFKAFCLTVLGFKGLIRGSQLSVHSEAETPPGCAILISVGNTIRKKPRHVFFYQAPSHSLSGRAWLQ